MRRGAQSSGASSCPRRRTGPLILWLQQLTFGASISGCPFVRDEERLSLQTPFPAQAAAAACQVTWASLALSTSSLRGRGENKRKSRWGAAGVREAVCTWGVLRPSHTQDPARTPEWLSDTSFPPGGAVTRTPGNVCLLAIFSCDVLLKDVPLGPTS